jgi:predicted nucleotidyltransferase
MALDPIEARHAAVLQNLIEVAEADDRVVAAWLQGSRADGTADPFSDIDLYLAISDEAYESFDRIEFIERAARVLVHAELPGNLGVVCLVQGPVKLDLLVEKISAIGQMQRPAAKMLVDKDDVEAKLVTGWTPDRNDVANEVDRLLRMTYQGASWPIRLLRRGQWMTHAYSELTLIHNMIVPLLLAPNDLRAFQRNPMTRERLLSDAEREEIDALAKNVLALLAGRSPKKAYDAHLSITDMLGRAGRAACDAFDIEFPEAAEQEALQFYEREWPQEEQ